MNNVIFLFNIFLGVYYNLVVVTAAVVVEKAPSAGRLELAQVRPRREGFGPWEANDAWDETGKSNPGVSVEKLLEGVYEEEQKILATVRETLKFVHEMEELAVEFVRHPVQVLSRSLLGVIIMVVCGIVALYFLIRGCSRFLDYASNAIAKTLSCLFWPFRKLSGLITRLVKRSACCMCICALAPFVKIRNLYIAWRLKRSDAQRIIAYTVSDRMEAVELVKRVKSRVKTDETGAYLDAGDGTRVYLEMEHAVEDMAKLQMFGTHKREECVANNHRSQGMKETIIQGSKLYKVDKVPDFQGLFEVEGVDIGHFSRIKFEGQDCILTAFHVLDYNKSSIVNLRKGDKIVRFDTVRTRFLAASPTDQLDFAIIAVPSSVFSILGLKVGTVATQVKALQPISIYQYYQGNPCVASAPVRRNDKQWFMDYKASTMVGASGAPILDVKQRIIGVHIEHDQATGFNVGVMPPVFRNRRKESPTNEDLFAGAEDFVLDTKETEDERDARINAEIEAEEDYISWYADARREAEAITDANDSWAEQVDAIDNILAKRSDYRRDPTEKRPAYKTYYSKVGGSGKHIGGMVKGGRVRKESPWSCSKCGTMHLKRGYNCLSCGFALVKAPTVKERATGSKLAQKYLSEEIGLPLEIREKIDEYVTHDNVVAAMAEKICLFLALQAEKGREIAEARRDPNVGGLVADDFRDLRIQLNEIRHPIESVSLRPETGVMKRVTSPLTGETHDAFRLLSDYTVPVWEPVDCIVGELEEKVVIKGNAIGETRVCQKAVNGEVARALSFDSFVPIRKKETLVAPSAPLREEQVVQPAQPSASTKRRRRARAKKATQEIAPTTAPAVHPKVSTPANAGAPTTSGMKSSRIPIKVPASAGAGASSKAEKEQQKKIYGNASVKNTQNTKNSGGPREEPRLRKPASSSK